jgi:hypothetical protein
MNNDSAARYHLGVGRLELRRQLSVFVNCPYDEEFRPLFDAIVFSTLCCGFIPRCAIESGSTSLSRMDRIFQAMHSSKYSIHDLSRCRGEGESNLARFNMPLELGMAMAEQFGADGDGHDWMLLVPKGHIYRKFASDLAGFDATEHDESVATIVPAVMSWLATRPDAVRCPTPQTVLDALPAFQEARDDLCKAWCGHEPWADLLMTGLNIGVERSIIPLN